MLVYVGVIAIVSVLFVALVTQTAYAEYSYKHIAIEFSESCQLLQLLNDTQTCSSSEFLKSMYSETKLKPSFQKLFDNAQDSKRSDYQKNDILLNHKMSCISKNYCNVFDVDENQTVLYWYEPDNSLRGLYDGVITISPNILPKNIDSSEPIISENQTRTLHLQIDRFHVSNCWNVAYNPDVIWQELGFLIWYVADDCTDSKKLGILDRPYTKQLKVTKIDITTSSNWQYLQEQKRIISQYTKNYIGED